MYSPIFIMSDSPRTIVSNSSTTCHKLQGCTVKCLVVKDNSTVAGDINVTHGSLFKKKQDKMSPPAIIRPVVSLRLPLWKKRKFTMSNPCKAIIHHVKPPASCNDIGIIVLEVTGETQHFITDPLLLESGTNGIRTFIEENTLITAPGHVFSLVDHDNDVEGTACTNKKVLLFLPSRRDDKQSIKTWFNDIFIPSLDDIRDHWYQGEIPIFDDADSYQVYEHWSQVLSTQDIYKALKGSYLAYPRNRFRVEKFLRRSHSNLYSIWPEGKVPYGVVLSAGLKPEHLKPLDLQVSMDDIMAEEEYIKAYKQDKHENMTILDHCRDQEQLRQLEKVEAYIRAYEFGPMEEEDAYIRTYEEDNHEDDSTIDAFMHQEREQKFDQDAAKAMTLQAPTGTGITDSPFGKGLVFLVGDPTQLGPIKAPSVPVAVAPTPDKQRYRSPVLGLTRRKGPLTPKEDAYVTKWKGKEPVDFIESARNDALL
jgi:hypothetical protein